MTQDTRTLRIGVIAIALLAALLTTGFLLVNRKAETRPTLPTSTQSTSASPVDPKAAVEQSYLNYWSVYTEALRALDTSRLGAVLDGSALRAVRQQIADQRRLNEPVEVRVEHDFEVFVTGANAASVDEHYVNHSVRLDGKTGRPKENDPNERVHNSYTLKKVNGQWKITEIIEYQ